MDWARVHFIGIGGVSMEALAKLLAEDGVKVSGSDSSVGRGHRATNIHKGIDAVVLNGAISDDNVEYLRAKKLGIKIIDRSDLLAMIESRYTNRVAVAGTHGKSTTTAMIGAVMAGLNPTVHNGARPNLVIGGREFFITEACEFKRSFLKLSPTVAVITNIDVDHMDCYRDLDDIKAAFKQFSDKTDAVIAHDGDIDCHEYRDGYYSFDVEGEQIRLGVPGRHNVMNAMLAVRVGLHFGVSISDIKDALENFTGIERRFQFETDNIVFDYAHHPTEIQTTIDTANRIFGKGRYLVVFQPHTFTRTVALFDDFVSVLSGADCVLYKTFSAREKPIKGGTAGDIANALGVRYFKSQRGLEKYLGKIARKYCAIILTGAGDINRIKFLTI